MTNHGPTSRSFARIVMLGSACAATVFLATGAYAQLTDFAASGAGGSGTAAPGTRDAEYAALARDVDILDRELSLVKRVVKLVTPSVVHIEATPLPKYQGLLKVEEAGSGAIVEFGSKFYVLTNRHVIRHSIPEKIEIHLADGRVFHPKQIWSDSETDVAIMAIDATGLAAVKLGDSDKLEIGDFVLAVGSPFGLSQSVTRGIVSAKGRHNLDLGDDDLRWQNFLQTDAAINPGNSGGPLVNLRGEVVGLNTAIASASGGNEGIGFSIPVNVVSRIAQALLQEHGIPRGFLGVQLDGSFNEKKAKSLGLGGVVGTRVTRVEPKSPAELADLRIDDVILEFNGIRVDQDMHLISLVKLTEIGKQVELVVLRDGKVFRTNAAIVDARDFERGK